MSSPVSVIIVTLKNIKRAHNNIYTCKVSETLSYLEFSMSCLIRTMLFASSTVFILFAEIKFNVCQLWVIWITGSFARL